MADDFKIEVKKRGLFGAKAANALALAIAKKLREKDLVGTTNLKPFSSLLGQGYNWQLDEQTMNFIRNAVANEASDYFNGEGGGGTGPGGGGDCCFDTTPYGYDSLEEMLDEILKRLASAEDRLSQLENENSTEPNVQVRVYQTNFDLVQDKLTVEHKVKVSRSFPAGNYRLYWDRLLNGAVVATGALDFAVGKDSQTGGSTISYPTSSVGTSGHIRILNDTAINCGLAQDKDKLVHRANRLLKLIGGNEQPPDTNARFYGSGTATRADVPSSFSWVDQYNYITYYLTYPSNPV